MGSADSSLVAVARPSLAVDGNVDAALAGRLIELLVHEDVHGLCRCEALFNNWGRTGTGASANSGFLYFDRRTLEFGKRFEVKIGDTSVFDGRVTALQAQFASGDARISVMAEDRLQDLRMTRRSRSFSNVGDAAVFRQIAQDHGLTAQVNLTGPTHKVLAQVNQSDLAFLRDRARALGAEVWVRGTTLHAAPRSSRQSGQITLTQDIDLHDFRVTADLSGQASAVVVSGWDVSAKTAISEEAGPGLLSGELGSDKSGAAILESAFAQRKQTLAHAVPHSADEASALAKAQFLRGARRFVVGHGSTAADPNLRVGTNVKLQGLGPLFNGKYYVAETRLRFDARAGLRIEFTGERAGLGQP